MTYKVVNFRPTGHNSSSQLEDIIVTNSNDGWEYVETTMISTYQPGSDGCFGFGAKAGYNQTEHVAVFKRS
ncbi:MAG: hypothetical protein WAT52_06010 [Chitinophagales bacterium]